MVTHSIFLLKRSGKKKGGKSCEKTKMKDKRTNMKANALNKKTEQVQSHFINRSLKYFNPM